MKSLLYAFLVVFAILAIPSFAVVTTDDDDYDEDEDTVAVDSTALQASLLEMPNAFSPNGDGINDTYHVKKYQNITEFRALIFNRWGQCLYTWNEIDGSWDGTYKGRPVKDGVYFVTRLPLDQTKLASERSAVVSELEEIDEQGLTDSAAADFDVDEDLLASIVVADLKHAQ
jgi:gliding motility-associated-like protein